MGNDMVVRNNAKALSTASARGQSLSVRPDRPLGTAGWLEFPEDQPLWPTGGFHIGCLKAGAEIGIRDDRHVLITSGTRGGKDATIIMPNLIRWPGSLVVIDPKGESAIVTARRRGRGSAYSRPWNQKVYVLDPFNAVHRPDDDFMDVKARFNPLDLLSASQEDSVHIAGLIADSLVIPEAGEHNHWNEAAQQMIKAIILDTATSHYVAPDQSNLGHVRKTLVEGDTEMRRLMALNATVDNQEIPSSLALLFARMKRNPAFGGIVAEAGERYANLLESSPRTLASTVEVACTHTDFLSDPAMRRHLMQSDFSLSELKTAPHGISMFLSLPQKLMGTHGRWLRMMTALTMGEMENSHTQPACGHPVLMVINEFAGLRRMKSIEDGVAQIAGYGVKMVFVTQTLAQLKEVYKDNWETFIANCGIKLFFCNDDHFTRDYVSKLIGEHEVTRSTTSESQTKGASTSNSSSSTSGTSVSFNTSHSHSSSFGQQGLSSGSSVTHSKGTTYSHSTTNGQTRGVSESHTQGVTETVHKRPLLAPDEVGRVFGDRDRPMALALLSGLQPLALQRLAYFENSYLAGFYDPHPAYSYPPNLIQREALKALEEKRCQEENEARAREETQRIAIAQAQKKAREDQQLTEKLDKQYISEYERDFRNTARLKKKFVNTSITCAVMTPIAFIDIRAIVILIVPFVFCAKSAINYRNARAFMRLFYAGMPSPR